MGAQQAVAAMQDLGLPPFNRSENADDLLGKTPKESNDSQRFAVKNVRINIVGNDEDQAGPLARIELILLHSGQNEVGKIELSFDRAPDTAPGLIEEFLQSHEAGPDTDGDAVLRPEELKSFLEDATEAGALVTSTMGYGVEEIVAQYATRLARPDAGPIVCGFVIDHDHVIKPMDRAAADVIDTQSHVAWIDLNGEPRSADAALKKIIPGVPAISSYLRHNTKAQIVDHHIIAEAGICAIDEQDPFKVTRTEMQIVVGPGALVTYHNDTSDALQTMQAEFPSFAALNKSHGKGAGALLCWVLSEILVKNEEAVNSLEKTVSKLNRELIQEERLQPQTLKRDLPQLYETLAYFERKLREHDHVLKALLDLASDKDNRYFNVERPEEMVRQVETKLENLLERIRILTERTKWVRDTNDSVQNSKVNSNIWRMTAAMGASLAIDLSNFVHGEITIERAITAGACVTLLFGIGKMKKWW